MSIYDYEKFTTYGALDSNAFDDNAFASGGPEMYGMPYSAHLLRTMGMDHNRLMTKPESLFNLIWPSTTREEHNEEDIETFGGIALPEWKRVHPPIPIFKKPGHTKLDVYFTMRVEVKDNSAQDATIFVQVATGAQPFSHLADNSATGVEAVTANLTDSFTDYTISGVRMLPGTYDELSIWIKGDYVNVAPATGTFGSPTSGTLDQNGDYVTRRTLVDQSATWVRSGTGSRNLASEGYLLLFTDGTNPILAPRQIDAITRAASDAGTLPMLNFSPELTTQEHQAVVSYSGGMYEIVSSPHWWISNLLGVSQARDL